MLNPSTWAVDTGDQKFKGILFNLGGPRPACSMRSCLRVQQGIAQSLEGAALLCRITVGQRREPSDMQGSGFPS